MSRYSVTSRGFTLMELMLGLAVSAMVAAAAGAMLIGSSNVFRASDSSQSAELLAERLVARLAGTLAACRRVGAVNADASGFDFTVWCKDANSDGVPQLSEMAVVRWIAATGQLAIYQQELPGSTIDSTVTAAQMDAAGYAASFTALSTCKTYPIATGTGGVKVSSLSVTVRKTRGLANTISLVGTAQSGVGTAYFYQTVTLRGSVQY